MGARQIVSSTTTTSASVATASVQIIGANPSRSSFMLYNNSANSCYVNFGPTASSSACSLIIPTFATWAWPFANIDYTGAISAIRNAGTGTIILTEFRMTGWG